MFPALDPHVALLIPPPATAGSAWRPSDLFPGWSCDGTTITLPLASVYGLSSANADGTTGDARAVVAALLATMVGWYMGLSSRPQAIVGLFRPGVVPSYGSFSGKQKTDLGFTVYQDFPTGALASEP